MRDLQSLLSLFAYHPATPEVAQTYSNLRAAFKPLAEQVWDLVPDGPEKTLALRKLHEALMYANLAVALTSPEAEEGTDHVARILPEDADALLLVAETLERKHDLELEKAKALNVIKGQCYGPIASAVDTFDPSRVAKCHHNLCTWEFRYTDGDFDMAQLQNKHNDAGAALWDA